MKSKLLLILKGIGIAAAGAVVAQVTNQGIDATPLHVLPPVAKLSISLAAPVVGAWLRQSPLNGGN